MTKRNSLRKALFLAPMLAWPAVATAVTGIVLPAWVCTQPDAIFVGGFEAGEQALAHYPTHGSGGAYPGKVTQTLMVVGMGTQTYYLYVPTHYTPSRAWPLMLALHGAGGAGKSAYAARQVRADWTALAEAQGFIVAAPVGSDPQGGWIAPDLNGQGPSDYGAIAGIVAAVGASYNIESSRKYAWGYSAGGEILDDIVLTGWVGLNADTFGAYAVTGTALAGCPSYNVVQSCVPANATRVIPLDIHIGSTDPIYTQGYAASDKNKFLAAGWSLGTTLYYTVFTGGHTYSTIQLAQVWTNLCPNAVVP